MHHVRIKAGAILITALSALALAGCYPMIEATAEERASFPIPNGLELVVEATNGHVEIRGSTNASQIEVLATLKAGAPTRTEANEQLAKIEVEMYLDGHQLILKHEPDIDFMDRFNRYESVAFDVLVPTEVELDLNTSNGHIEIISTTGNVTARSSNGHIEIRNVRGDLDLRTSNGRISAVEAAGQFNARTSNGAIEYEGRLIGSSHSARTSNGSIRLEIPRDLELNIRASVGNGRISSSLPLSGDHEGRSWSATLNAPTANLELSTSNGSIRIEELR